MMRKFKNFKQKEFYLVLLLGFVSVFTLITITNSNRVGKESDDNQIIDSNEVVDKPTENTEPVINVLASGKKDKSDDLKFNEEEGMKWPLVGEILLPYSMDRGIYFATLDQYKCNPAICIEAEVGTIVNAAAMGRVEKSTPVGAIQTPTKYYVKNGPHLYFKVLKDGKPIDPSTIVK